uniref:Uncharacterized protein n=1 Tax=Triticum urartu TaxID=4572 RepID=A0A8R7QJ54_TRIUA
MHYLTNHFFFSICRYEYVEDIMIWYNTITYHQINETKHIMKRFFHSIPMKQNAVGSNGRFLAQTDHRIKNLPSFCASSALAKIIHLYSVSYNIWLNTISRHFLENPINLFAPS